MTVRHLNRNPEIGFDIIEDILRNSFKMQKRFFNDVPQLNVGDKGDFIILDYIPYTPLNSKNFLGHFIYGICESSVRTMCQNGRFLMKDFIVDREDEIYKKAYKIGEKVRENFIRLTKS